MSTDQAAGLGSGAAPCWVSNGATEVLINGRRYIPAPRAELNGSMGQQICEAREHAGYSLSAAAKMLGISKAHLWEIEAGRQTNPTLQTMLALMQCYGLSAHVFLPPNARAQGRVAKRSVPWSPLLGLFIWVFFLAEALDNFRNYIRFCFCELSFFAFRGIADFLLQLVEPIATITKASSTTSCCAANC